VKQQLTHIERDPLKIIHF